MRGVPVVRFDVAIGVRASSLAHRARDHRAIFDVASTFPLMMRPSNSGLTGPSGLAAAMPATAAAAAGAADDGERHVGSEVMVEHEGETFHAVVTQYFPPDDNDSEVPRSSSFH